MQGAVDAGVPVMLDGDAETAEVSCQSDRPTAVLFLVLHAVGVNGDSSEDAVSDVTVFFLTAAP